MFEIGLPSVHSKYTVGTTPVMSRISRRTAAIVFGTLPLATRSTR